MSDSLRLDGRVAVVVGAARGIGAAIGRTYADAGARVVLADVLPAVEQTAAAIGADAGFVLDVRDSVAVEAVATASAQLTGTLDIWVNCSGISPMTPVCDMTDAEWGDVISVNLTGTFYGARAAARRLSPGGVIVNVTSTSGYRASSDGRAHYVASKHGVRGLTRALARELGPRGIRVLAIAPTLTVTERILAAQVAHPDAPQSNFEEFAARLPMRRLGTPEDVARVALFCASELSGFVTGTTIPVDGGHLSI